MTVKFSHLRVPLSPKGESAHLDTIFFKEGSIKMTFGLETKSLNTFKRIGYYKMNEKQ